MKGVDIELFTSHWRSTILENVAAVMVSISRGQPRRRLPFKYRKLMSLAPCNEAWNADDQEAFERAYTAQLEGLGTERILEDLRRITGGQPGVLLCWERPDEEFCHRWMLSDFLYQEAGIVVPELSPGDLPQCQDDSDMRLF